jgi:hypothetical protein
VVCLIYSILLQHKELVNTLLLPAAPCYPLLPQEYDVIPDVISMGNSITTTHKTPFAALYTY